MSASVHTPGPWEIETNGQWGLVSADGRDGQGWIICDLGVHVDLSCSNRDYVSQQILDEVDANARLIKAAPDLLASLVEIMDAMDDGSDEPALVAARAAIASATGAS